MRVLVTGANGLLGHALCEELLNQGMRPVGYVRHPESATRLSRQGIDYRVGSLSDRDLLSATLSNIDAVIHAAGGGKGRGRASFYENNVVPTQQLLTSIPPSPKRRFILVSSLAAVGPSQTGLPHSPETTLDPISPYGVSKAEAERLTLEYAESLHVTIFRPPMIYGPHDWRLLPLFKAAKRGLIPLIGGRNKTLSLIHVRDCARAIIRALTVEISSGQRFFVDDGQIHSFIELVGHLSRIFGRTPRLIPIPSSLLYGFSYGNVLMSHLMRSTPLLTPYKVKELLCTHWVSESKKTQIELSWQPQIRLADGLSQTAQWYLDRGWLSR